MNLTRKRTRIFTLPMSQGFKFTGTASVNLKTPLTELLDRQGNSKSEPPLTLTESASGSGDSDHSDSDAQVGATSNLNNNAIQAFKSSVGLLSPSLLRFLCQAL